MSWFFGVIFCLLGLALAVFLGLVLYREPKKELQTSGNVLKTGKNLKAA